MGYNTRFDVEMKGASLEELEAEVMLAGSWRNIPREKKRIYTQAYIEEMDVRAAKLSKLSAVDWNAFITMAQGGEGKFYDWRNQMCGISAMFPTVTFYLVWRGEEDDDWGHAEFLNGAMREAAAVLPPLPAWERK